MPRGYHILVAEGNMIMGDMLQRLIWRFLLACRYRRALWGTTGTPFA